MGNLIDQLGTIVKVRLSNPYPLALSLGNGVTAFPGTVEVDALVNTRAAMTSILPELIQFPLGLRRFRSLAQPAADRRTLSKTRTYAVDLEVVGNLLFPDLEASDGQAGAEFAEACSLLSRAGGGDPPIFQVILGRDVLRRANLM